MFKHLNRKRQKGQSTLEYAILIIIILGGPLSIQVYNKRGGQGRLKSATDDIGTQFSPGNTNVVKRMITSSRSADTFQDGVQRSELLEAETTLDIMNSDVMNIQQEYWGG